VDLLEICVEQFRRQLEGAPLENDIGPGNNRGPDLGPLSDKDINDAQSLLAFSRNNIRFRPQNSSRQSG